MILWPKQLQAIQSLIEPGGHIQSIELVALSHRVRTTISESSGKYKIIDIDDDGECDEIFSIS